MQALEPASALPTPSTRELVHTLNNQLSVVLAHAECAKDSEEPEVLRRALDSILQAATAMADSVREISRTTPSKPVGAAQRGDSMPT